LIILGHLISCSLKQFHKVHDSFVGAKLFKVSRSADDLFGDHPGHVANHIEVYRLAGKEGESLITNALVKAQGIS